MSNSEILAWAKALHNIGTGKRVRVAYTQMHTRRIIRELLDNARNDRMSAADVTICTRALELLS